MGLKCVTILGLISLLTLSCQFLPTVDCGNVVFFQGMSSYSHRSPTWPIAVALAERGHNVTFVSPTTAKIPHPKIYDYTPPVLKAWVDSWIHSLVVYDVRKSGDPGNAWGLAEAGVAMCEVMYSDPDFVKWIKRTKVDLIYIDGLFNDCGYGMADYWGAKVILLQTFGPIGYYVESYGMPDETSWIPSIDYPLPVEMTFAQRVVNALGPIAWDFHRRWQYFPRLEEVTKEKLDFPGVSKFEDIERNTAMVFLNTHYGEEYPRALPPNVIGIGGILNNEKRTPLHKDLDEFLNKGKGFIYVSFGTHVDFLQIEPKIQQAFIGAMNSLPQVQFVWKIGDDSFAKELTKGNVYMNTWMPQQDILAHPKAKGFITHSGLLGIQEAVHHAVPLICFPFFAEQDYNAERIHWRESGIKLEITTVTQAELVDTITKIISDPKYKTNMKKVSMLSNERPQKVLDTAVWWSEFVLRHTPEELSALRPLSVGQPWWKKRQLDVWATIMGIVAGLFIAITYIFHKIINSIFCKKSGTSPSQQKKKRQ